MALLCTGGGSCVLSSKKMCWGRDGLLLINRL